MYLQELALRHFTNKYLNLDASRPLVYHPATRNTQCGIAGCVLFFLRIRGGKFTLRQSVHRSYAIKLETDFNMTGKRRRLTEVVRFCL